MASNQRAKEGVQESNSLVQHARTVASTDTKQVTVGAMLVHAETRKAKARTERQEQQGPERQMQAGSFDDAGQTQQPETETGPLGLGAVDASQGRVVQFLEPMEQRICGINKCKASGHVKFYLGYRCSSDGISL